jgi:hypothetical protein
MRQYSPFKYHGRTYNLSHLNELVVTYIQPASGRKPQKKYKVVVLFSHHCFTRKDSENTDPDLVYNAPGKKDPRVFDFGRYELSKKLPHIIQNLDKRECFHTNHGAFFTIDIQNTANKKVEYEIYFDVYCPKRRTETRQRPRLTMIVQSAYKRDEERKEDNRPRKKKIKLFAILYNVQKGKRPHPAL